MLRYFGLHISLDYLRLNMQSMNLKTVFKQTDKLKKDILSTQYKFNLVQHDPI